MKFIRYDEYRINLEAIAHYRLVDSALVIRFQGGLELTVYDNDAADLVALLDEAIVSVRRQSNDLP